MSSFTEGVTMSSPRCRLFVLLMSGIAMACADTTSPVAPAVEEIAGPLPSLTWQGADGPRTATLLGANIVLENGARIAIDTATARNFRRLAIAMPKLEALAQRMAPVWTKMGLPTPTSGPQARVALAALRTRMVATTDLDGVLALATPIEKPTLVADCDATMQFCGFDTSDDPSGGGSGGSGGSGSSGSGPCDQMAIVLYQYIGQWRGALTVYDQAVRDLAYCTLYYGPSSPVMCGAEAWRLTTAVWQLDFYASQMLTQTAAMRAMGCS